MLANLVFWRLMLFYIHLLLLLQPSVPWLSIATFNNDVKPPPKWILREFDVFRFRPLTLKRLHGKIWPRLRGLPGLADRLRGSPHLSCKRDPRKMRDYMDRRVTPPKRVTSPTWGSSPPCKQALNQESTFMFTRNTWNKRMDKPKRRYHTNTRQCICGLTLNHSAKQQQNFQLNKTYLYKEI